MLQELGAAVVDADRIAREVVAPGGPAFEDVVREFGREILAGDGTIDRKRLGARIFADSDARMRLNARTHPHIERRMSEEAARLSAPGGAPIIVFDIPLLLDTTDGRELGLDGIVVVAAPEEVRVRRAAARDGLAPDEARRRLAAQVPLEHKIARADWVIENGGTPEATREQVERLWREWLG
jgi:dephospho-CoA kinase